MLPGPSPSTRLGTAQSFAELDHAEFAEAAADAADHRALPGAGGAPALGFHQGGADARDGFHQFGVVEATDWFGVDESFGQGGDGIEKACDPELGAEVELGEHEHFFSCMGAVPAGWPGALRFCHGAVAARAAVAAKGGWGGLLPERASAPRLAPGQPARAARAGDRAALGRSAADVQQAHRDFEAQRATFGLDLHDEVTCSPRLEALGLQFDGPC